MRGIFPRLIWLLAGGFKSVLNLIGWLGIGFGIGLLIAVYKVLSDPKEDIDKTIDRAIRGAKAEEKVSDILEGLSKGYAVFNDFRCPMGNIDHIAIGPTGIFVVETKSPRGEITQDVKCTS